ncbi:MAG TPA: class I SAM-dependent methyltransferase [Bacteroidales bacterium]|nr:class I SAM-dependent methyltransferase [Bacteroidales bacterium]HRZ77446.1 class I SAM-dependent methyltransferase [Bacteroidales bacterium]
MPEPFPSHQDQVRRFFGNTRVFLERNFVTALRHEALGHWTAGMRFHHVIDLACGDGTLGLSLLPHTGRLTLLDLSPEMLEIAQGKIPVQEISRVHLLRADLMEADLPHQSFDLVICTGMLAHVIRPEDAFRKLAALCTPGGYLLLQNTNDQHAYSRVVSAWGRLRRWTGKETYPLSRIRGSQLRKWALEEGMQELHRYRSIVSFMFMSRYLSGECKGKIVRGLFGTPESPRRQALGNDEIILFRKEDHGQAQG